MTPPSLHDHSLSVVSDLVGWPAAGIVDMSHTATVYHPSATTPVVRRTSLGGVTAGCQTRDRRGKVVRSTLGRRPLVLGRVTAGDCRQVNHLRM